MTTTGLQIIGCIGHEVLRDHANDWKAYAAKLGELDWRRSNSMWTGNVVAPDGKILTQSNAVVTALQAVREAIGLNVATLSKAA